MPWKREYSFQWKANHKTMPLRGNPFSQGERKFPDLCAVMRKKETYVSFSSRFMEKSPCCLLSPLSHVVREHWLFPAHCQSPQQQHNKSILPKAAENDSPLLILLSLADSIPLFSAKLLLWHPLMPCPPRHFTRGSPGAEVVPEVSQASHSIILSPLTGHSSGVCM